MVQETKNRVLRCLEPEVRDAVLRECDLVDMEGRTEIIRLGETANAVHFPETLVISALATYRDGSTIEMANIGRESCTGVSLALGHPRQLMTTEVQVGGTTLEMPASRFEELKRAYPQFETILLSTVQAVFYQVMVSGACNGAHGSKQRLARWLLTMSDRTDGETMRLTQEFLAEMLALRRATVSDAASELQEAGLIDYSRGRITIIDRPGLRRASCECYDLVRNAYDSLLPCRSD